MNEIPRYIDGNRLKQEIVDIKEHILASDCPGLMKEFAAQYFDAFIRHVERSKTADVMPVVRKRSCMNWIRSDNPGYSPFDGSSEYIWTCSFCGAKEEIPAPFCRFCGRKYVSKEGQEDGI